MRSIRKMLRAVPWKSEAWVAYYESNHQNLMRLPWQRGAQWTEAEKDALAASLQDFQLGESSEGHNLRQRAAAHADQTADPAYAVAMDWFIREEQRHSATLAKFLSLAGIPLAEHTRLDAAFRWCRRLAGLELFLCVLLTAEMIGKVYYRAVLQASASPLLRGICTQLLRDEVRHLRFHRERLARMRRRRSSWKLRLTFGVHRLFFQGTCLAVWLKHRRAFCAGGFSFAQYWTSCNAEWQVHRRQSHPSYFDFESQRETAKRAATTRVQAA